MNKDLKPDPAKPEESVHHEIGDDKGEGGEKDIKTDSVETSHAGDKGEVRQDQDSLAIAPADRIAGPERATGSAVQGRGRRRGAVPLKVEDRE